MPWNNHGTSPISRDTSYSPVSQDTYYSGVPGLPYVGQSPVSRETVCSGIPGLPYLGQSQDIPSMQGYLVFRDCGAPIYLGQSQEGILGLPYQGILTWDNPLTSSVGILGLHTRVNPGTSRLFPAYRTSCVFETPC